jgi:hypothetical protein
MEDAQNSASSAMLVLKKAKDLERCKKIIQKINVIPKVRVSCRNYDGNPRTRHARGFFTAGDLEKDVEGHVPSPEIIIISERIHGGEHEMYIFLIEFNSYTLYLHFILFVNRKQLLEHELIHAYDHLELGFDLSVCHELACSEIRAARAAECRSNGFLIDMACTFLPYSSSWCQNQTVKCVKSTAIKATSAMFSELEAKESVAKMFDQCFVNTKSYGKLMQQNSKVM